MIVVFNDTVDHLVAQAIFVGIYTYVFAIWTLQLQTGIESCPQPSTAVAILAVDMAGKTRQIGECTSEQCFVGQGLGLAPVIVDKCGTEGTRIEYASFLGAQPHASLTVEGYGVDIRLQ